MGYISLLPAPFEPIHKDEAAVMSIVIFIVHFAKPICRCTKMIKLQVHSAYF